MAHFNRLDICLAWHVYAAFWHGGQSSKLYRVFGRLQKIGFNPPSNIEDIMDCLEGYPKSKTLRDEYENAKLIYQSLVERKIHQ